MNINLELYKVFYYVAKNKSISRAADELLVSQPAVSKSIKTLEDQINTKLFLRKRDGMELTVIGETFYNKIKSAMDLIESAENDLEVLTTMDSGTLSIGSSKTILHEFLMPYITAFHSKYPKINIRISTEKLTESINKSKLNIIDLVFLNMPFTLPENFDSYKIMTLHDCFAANNSFSYLKNKKIDLKELETFPLLVLNKGATTRRRLDDFCDKNNIKINPHMELGGNTLIREFTEAGFGIGLLTEEHIKKDLENGSLFKLDVKLELEEKYLAMAWNKDNKSLVAKNFIKFIIEQLEEEKCA